MDSQPAPPPAPLLKARKLRPWYLALAMALTWLVAVSGLMNGCSTVMILQQDSVLDAAAELSKQSSTDPLQAVWVALYSAQFNATMAAYEITFPLNVARILLSGLLVVASVLAMGGRRGARSLAIQAILANCAFAAIDYALTRSVRASWIDAVGRVGDMLQRPLVRRGDPMDHEALLSLFTNRQVWWWLERARLLLLEVGIFGFAALALITRRTKAYFDAVAEATARAEEEEDEP
jgi:hypothetical protein